jgi:hypothetical protein
MGVLRFLQSLMGPEITMLVIDSVIAVLSVALLFLISYAIYTLVVYIAKARKP